jgi:hypothetical protein
LPLFQVGKETSHRLAGTANHLANLIVRERHLNARLNLRGQLSGVKEALK